VKREREPRVVFGFHAVLARLRADPQSVVEIFLDETRHDARIKDVAAVAERAGVKVMKVPTKRLDGFYGGGRHQGVVARIEAKSLSHSLDEILEKVQGPPLLLLLDGVTIRTTSAPACAWPTLRACTRWWRRRTAPPASARQCRKWRAGRRRRRLT
jgi:hypothetical protein